MVRVFIVLFALAWLPLVCAKPHTLIVTNRKFMRRLRNEHLRRLARGIDCEVNITALKELHAEIIETSPSCNLKTLCDELHKQDEIELCEEDYQVFPHTPIPYSIPMSGPPTDDPYVGSCEQWGLTKINVQAAWAIHYGDQKTTNTTVGVMDSGMDMDHPDLVDAFWTNPDEVPNGQDDDLNGLVDDIHGWDGLNHDADPDDDNGHGSHCGGIVGAVRNNGIGVAGISPAKLMPLKFIGKKVGGSMSVAIILLNYAIGKGVRIMAMQFGSFQASANTKMVMERSAEKGVLMVISAGNDGNDNDHTGYYPCDYDLDNIICVGAIDQDGIKAGFSNYGRKHVDVMAPGVAIRSTVPPGLHHGKEYDLAAGTSQAAPHVSGLAALIWDFRPEMTWQDVKHIIINTTDNAYHFWSLNQSGYGIINAKAAMERAKAWVSPNGPKMKVQQKFASLDATHCTDTLPYGPLPVASTTGSYLTTSLKGAVHSEWKQEISALGDGQVNMRISWMFQSPKTLQQRFYDAAMKGEPVTWVIEYAGQSLSKTGTWWWSDSEGNADFGAIPGKFNSQGASFSAANGAWGGATGDVNGNCVSDPARTDRRKCPSDFYGILDDYGQTEATGCSHLYVGNMNAPRHYPSMTTAMYVVQEEPMPSASVVAPTNYPEPCCECTATECPPNYGGKFVNEAKNNAVSLLVYGAMGVVAFWCLCCCICHLRRKPKGFKEIPSSD